MAKKEKPQERNGIFFYISTKLPEIKDKYPRHSHIFTGGSKLEKTTGCAATYTNK